MSLRQVFHTFYLVVIAAMLTGCAGVPMDYASVGVGVSSGGHHGDSFNFRFEGSTVPQPVYCPPPVVFCPPPVVYCPPPRYYGESEASYRSRCDQAAANAQAQYNQAVANHNAQVNQAAANAQAQYNQAVANARARRGW